MNVGSLRFPHGDVGAGVFRRGGDNPVRVPCVHRPTAAAPTQRVDRQTNTFLLTEACRKHLLGGSYAGW